MGAGPDGGGVEVGFDLYGYLSTPPEVPRG
jgi:hypothetical protein